MNCSEAKERSMLIFCHNPVDRKQGRLVDSLYSCSQIRQQCKDEDIYYKHQGFNISLSLSLSLFLLWFKQLSVLPALQYPGVTPPCIVKYVWQVILYRVSQLAESGHRHERLEHLLLPVRHLHHQRRHLLHGLRNRVPAKSGVSLCLVLALRLPADGRRDGQAGGEGIVRHLLVHHFQSVQPAGVVGVVGDQRGRGRVIQRLQGENSKV